MIGIYLATEDPLSGAVGEKLLGTSGVEFRIELRFPTHGNEYLRERLEKFNKIATHTVPVMLITDLDDHPCPSSLIKKSCGRIELSHNLLFRVAVRETEAWLLADRECFAEFTGIPLSKISNAPENLEDPKRALLNLIRRFCKSRGMKSDLLPEPGAKAKVGLGYNPVLCQFVREHWSPQRADANAPNLARTRTRIREFGRRIALELLA